MCARAHMHYFDIFPKSPALSSAASEGASKMPSSTWKVADRCSLATSETLPATSSPSSLGLSLKNPRKCKAKVQFNLWIIISGFHLW